MGKGFSKDYTYNVDWEEDKKLGEGQYADVYKIENLDKKKIYAAKFFKVPL